MKMLLKPGSRNSDLKPWKFKDLEVVFRSSYNGVKEFFYEERVK